MPKPNWSRKLTAPLYTRDGQTIATLSHARAFMLELPDNYSTRNHWQRAAELMLEASKGGGIDDASLQIRKALFFDMKLDVTKTPP